MVPDSGTGTMCDPPGVSAVGLRLVSVIIYIFYLLPSRNILPVNVNDSMIIRDSTSPGGKGMASVSTKW